MVIFQIEWQSHVIEANISIIAYNGTFLVPHGAQVPLLVKPWSCAMMAEP